MPVIREFIALNFKSMIVTVNLKLGMRIEDLGKILTLDYIQTLEQRGIDPCGEGGEFHSTVLYWMARYLNAQFAYVKVRLYAMNIMLF